MTSERGAAQLESANAIRAYQREWLEDTRQRVKQGEPFAICNGDEFEEVFNIMDIPVIVINYWNSIIATKRMTEYYGDVLINRGYPANYFAMGLASTIDNNPETAPWGGLPKPALIIGGTKSDTEMKVLEIWAREYGCPFFPLDFGLDAVPELPKYPPPPRWWEMMADHWDELIDPRRLDLRVEEEKALINFIEVTTGRKLSMAKLEQGLELLNEQEILWGKARDLIAETIPCPVSLRDQLAVYQAQWHRGTIRGRDFIKAYYEEVKERVEKGVAACPNEKLRLMWMAGTPPSWAKWAEEEYGAVCVASLFSSIPIDSYYRATINGDVMRALASRHMVLFLETPDWRLKDAEIHQCNGVVETANPSIPSFNKQLFEEAGMPLCQIPRDRDDEEVRAILSDFIETRLLS
ncbi:MAG: 2-hydroxyacyl-CoA dehydratase [Dehalococcoidales bacterium]|nr:MAG: 2-hydroxyacyl-CoA dehydratase [Dehalococcoidales bacterium]